MTLDIDPIESSVRAGGFGSTTREKRNENS
jgi:hypothetical protein